MVVRHRPFADRGSSGIIGAIRKAFGG